MPEMDSPKTDMEAINELDAVVLTQDLPEYALKTGHIGTVVMAHRDGEAFEVESAILEGQTIGVVTLTRAQVRPIQHTDKAHARLSALDREQFFGLWKDREDMSDCTSSEWNRFT